jgi:hypothetical protein
MVSDPKSHPPFMWFRLTTFLYTTYMFKSSPNPYLFSFYTDAGSFSLEDRGSMFP